MSVYKVWVCLENEYDDIEADSEVVGAGVGRLSRM